MCENIIFGKTASEFDYEVNRNVLQNMELVDALAELDEGQPLALSKVVLLLLGKEQRKRLYNHLRQEDGTVPVTSVERDVTEIMKACGSQGKNS